jgi:hypothetical protein
MDSMQRSYPIRVAKARLPVGGAIGENGANAVPQARFRWKLLPAIALGALTITAKPY